MYTLIVLDGPDMGASYKLEPGVTLIGRTSSSATMDPAGFRRWELSDVTVSRTHCEIAYSDAGSPVLTHLSQTNQTLVNGKAVDDCLLEDGNYIMIGRTVLGVIQGS